MAGTPVEFVQADLSFFNFNSDTLVKVHTNMPTNLSLVDLAKPDTPEGPIKEYAQYISLTVTFEKGKSDLFWKIHEHIEAVDFDTSWLEGNAIRYNWNGKGFVKKGYVQYP